MDKERQEIILNDVKELFNQGKYQECVSLIKNTLLQQGIHIKLLTYLGASYANLKNYGLAMAAFTQYLYYVPNNVEIITNLAAVFYDLGDLHFAEEYLNKALQLNPDFPLLNKNLALFYFEMGDIPKALHYYHLAVKLMDTDSAHLGLSHALLCANHFTEGWREYEYRVSTLEYNSSFTFPFPRWQGENLNNKTLCIYTEQGIGDCIQFSRFIPLLKQQYNVKIILASSAVLIRLFSCFKEIDGFFYDPANLPACDYYMLICSLPFHLKIHRQSQLKPKAYLHIDPALDEVWQQKLPKSDKFKIGICWRGNPKFTKNDRRCCSLKDFLFLRAYPRIELFSLQKEITPDEAELLMMAGILNLGQEFNDFADTGAAINQLDLVISVDTSIPHLTGALGKPIWTLLTYYNEWRYPAWLDTSPWYSSMKCIRQTHPGDWESVFVKVDEMIKFSNIAID